MSDYSSSGQSKNLTVFETGEALKMQGRVIGALVLREVRTRFGASKVGYLWALIEPISHILILSGLYMAMGRRSPIGHSMSLFFVTGLFPFFLFLKTATRVGGSLNANKALLTLPAVKNVDVMFARGLLELATQLVIFIILIGALIFAGTAEAMPFDLLRVLSGVLVGWLLGFGVGCVSAVLNVLWKSWEHVFSMITRPLYLLSGAFFMVERIPPPMNKWLLYNPLLHANEWIRSGFYEGYGRYSLDRTYLLTWAIGALVIGLTSERLLRRKLYRGA